MGITISGGSIIGAQLGGRTNTAGFASVRAGGVDVKFQPGDVAMRQVSIGNNISLTIGAGMSQNMSINGINVRSQNGQLWVNGEQVDFKGGTVAPEAKKSAEDQLKSLQSRFPGVTFSGSPGGVQIDDSVKIAQGAKIELNPGLQLLGDTVIGPNAHVTGGTISNSQVDGQVMGGTVDRSEVLARALVNGGTVERSKLETGSTVNGGNVERSTLKGATVNGGNVERMTLEAGSTVNGGNLERFTLAAGKTINSGNHDGGLSENRGPTVNVTVGGSVSIGGRGGIVIQNVVSDGDLVIGDIVAGLRSGSFNAQTTKQMESFSRVVGNLDVVING